MAMKPIEEKPDYFLILRLFFISALIVVAIIFNRTRGKEAKPQSEVLGQTKTNPISLDSLQTGAKNLLDQAANQTEETLGDVLGQAQTFAEQTASKSASSVSDFIFDNTVGSIIKQIDKLPRDQQEDIRRNICQ